MIRFFVFFFLPFVVAAQHSIDLRSASLAELSGDLVKAHLLYKALPDDSSLVLSKTGHLALSLGLIDDAVRCSDSLLAKNDPQARQEGVLLKIRLLRLQNQETLAQKTFDDFFQNEAKPLEALLYEAVKLYRQKDSSDDKANLKIRIPSNTPEGCLLSESWKVLLDPAEIFPLEIPNTQIKRPRIQIGAFHNWQNLQVQVNKLKAFNWKPFVEKRTKTGQELYILFLFSENIARDSKKLKEQGFSYFLIP